MRSFESTVGRARVMLNSIALWLESVRRTAVAQQPAGEAEPVAWRYRYSGRAGNEWKLASEPAAQWAADVAGFKEEPLYTRPSDHPPELDVRSRQAMMNAALATQTSLCLPFPMRGGRFMAQVIIPRDMTKQEAEHLSAFVMSLAMPETVSTASGLDPKRATQVNKNPPSTEESSQ